MTPRQRFTAAEIALKEIEGERKALVAPTEARYDAALQELEDAEEGIEGVKVGRCETCDRVLFSGDRGYCYGDDLILECEDHAPTVADAISSLEISLKDGDDLDWADGPEDIEKALAGYRLRDPAERLSHEL